MIITTFTIKSDLISKVPSKGTLVGLLQHCIENHVDNINVNRILITKRQNHNISVAELHMNILD